MKVKGRPRGKPFNPGYDERRRPLTKADCRKGYAILQMRIQQGKIPSRIASAVRKKIGRRYGRYQD